MVQTQFKYFLTSQQRKINFKNTVLLLFDVFPTDNYVNTQMYDVWDTCNRYVQHILHLRDCFVEERKVAVMLDMCEMVWPANFIGFKLQFSSASITYMLLSSDTAPQSVCGLCLLYPYMLVGLDHDREADVA